jgi:lysyl-tRNA synthetase class 2
VHAHFDALNGQNVCVAGRLGVSKVLSKNLAFAFIADDSGQLQLIFHPRDFDEPTRLVYDSLDPGDFVGACGKVMKSNRGEVSVEVQQLTLLSKSLRNPPEKWHGLVDVETRYRQRYLDLMANPETRQVFLTRSRIITAIRHYLNARGFVEVETPILQTIPGGGSARPFATESYAMDTRMYLRIALELFLKRCIIGGIERVYEIGRNFRNEGVSFKHSPEFTMLELYQAYADYEDIMRLTEDMIATAARTAGRGSSGAIRRSTSARRGSACRCAPRSPSSPASTMTPTRMSTLCVRRPKQRACAPSQSGTAAKSSTSCLRRSSSRGSSSRRF